MGVQIVFGEAVESQHNSSMGVMSGNALINPTTAFAIPVIPSALSFAAVVLTDNLDFTQSHDLNFSIVNVGTQKNVSEIKGNFPIQNTNPLDTFNFNLNFRNVLFDEEGEYKLVFMLDDKLEGEQTFKIVQVPQG